MQLIYTIVDLDPYIIGSPGSGSVYYIRIQDQIQPLKTDHNMKNLEYL